MQRMVRTIRMTQIKLGDRVKDKITGLKGIAIGATDWLYGCRRICVQPEEAKDGKPAESFHVNEPQLELIKERVIVPPIKTAEPKRTHGPREDAARRQDARRLS